MYLNAGLLVVVFIMIIESTIQKRIIRQLTDEMNKINISLNIEAYQILNKRVTKKITLAVLKLKYQIVFSVLLVAVSVYRAFN